MSAAEDLLDYLETDERVESVVFGPWGWGSAPSCSHDEWEPGYGETDTPIVPFDVRGKVLPWDEAQEYMAGWSFYGGYGAPDCYATYVWTTRRVIWVTQYDGSTRLSSAPRNPGPIMPSMPGG